MRNAKLQVIPVLDVMNGVTVRGVAGRRGEYRPIESNIIANTEPSAVAAALQETFGLSEFYIADLDAIGGNGLSMDLLRSLNELGLALWVDAGIRSEGDAAELAEIGVGKIVLGLETVPAPSLLGRCCRLFGAERVVFSLDLKGGQSLAGPHWPARDPLAVAGAALDQGICQILILDLARVGVGEGTGTEALCQSLRARDADLFLAAGGGVRGLSDLRRLEACGVDAVMVASALHDGRITAEMLQELR